MSDFQLLIAHVQSEPPPFSTFRGTDVPESVEQVVHRCLSKEPKNRPASAADLRRQLLRAISTTPPPPPPPPRVLLIVLASLPVIAVLCVALWARQPDDVPVKAPDEGSSRPIGPIEPAEPPPIPGALLSLFEERGYRPIGGDGRTPEGWPATIERLDDGVRLALHGDVYIPEGYEPATEAGSADGLPESIVRSDGTRFMLVAGTDERGFLMGAPDGFGNMIILGEEQPPHFVPLSSFYMQQTEVSFGEIEAFLEESPDWDRGSPLLGKYRQVIDDLMLGKAKYKAHPAGGVTRELAGAYARHVGGRLPSEAQWEYAARSRGQDWPFVWRHDEDRDQANVESGGDFRLVPTHEATLDRPERIENRIAPGDITEQEIFDLAGNLREWCRDLWRPYPEHVPGRDHVERPRATDQDGANYVIRGGSYASQFPETARTTWRASTPRLDYRGGLTHSDYDLGFRVVVEVLPVSGEPSEVDLAE